MCRPNSLDEGSQKLKLLVCVFHPLMEEYQGTVSGKPALWVAPLEDALEEGVKVIKFRVRNPRQAKLFPGRILAKIESVRQRYVSITTPFAKPRLDPTRLPSPLRPSRINH